MINALGASTGVLDESMLAIVTGGFETLTATVTQVLTVSVPACVGIIALTAGVGYALRKVRSVIANAQ